jgi:hypothetical protein
VSQKLYSDVGTFTIPGAYSSIKVQSATSGLSQTGVLMLVGEAETGPRFSEEIDPDLEANAFGPDQLASVIAKYKAGPLVDAFAAAAQPANDAQIPGSFSRAILVKTNLSTKGSGILTNQASGTYGTLYDKSYGKLGNLIYYQVVASVNETLPTTGSFTYIPQVNTGALTVSYHIRVNGGSAVGTTFASDAAPGTLVSTLDGLAGVACTGGANRGSIISTTGTLTLVKNSARVLTVTYGAAWPVQPVVGDTWMIPNGSTFDGTLDCNVGAYVVTASTSNTMTVTKLSDVGNGAAVFGVITDVEAVGITGVGATPPLVYTPVTITLEAGDVIDGVGKSLEIGQIAGTVDLEDCFYNLGTTTSATWISKTGAAYLLTSAAEYRANLKVNRQYDSISEEILSGGEVAMKIGYLGTTGTVTISDTTFSTTVTGGAGGSISAKALTDYPTISDLCTYVNSLPGYTCSPGSAVLGNLPTTALDNVTAKTIATEFGAATGRLKIDGYRFFNAVSSESVLVQLGNPEVQADSGLPKVMASVVYLAGGTKGGSTTADFTAAIDALELVRGNFVVPLVSRNATLDYADALTESSSTYDIDSVNAYAKTHVLKMSTEKRRRNRQAFLSKTDTFTNAKQAAADIASFRCTMAFQDFKVSGQNGIVQYQSWMGAVLAAGMQAAAFYKAIFNKGINCSGVLMRDASFSDKNDTNLEDALDAGLMPARKSATGGYSFVSDQTTYGKDTNFVYNSTQATYIADTIALTLAQGFEQVFVGQSTADINAGLALSYLEAKMADFLALRMITTSDDAKKGFKNATVQITGGNMYVNVEVKLAGALYFVLIKALVSPVSQRAG